MKLIQVGTLLCLVILTNARDPAVRRVRVKNVRVQVEDQDEQPQQQQVVYQDYGQLERQDEEYQRPTPRTAIAQPRQQARVKETPREPPVETIRNYSNINDDGSFTFGYESADGSFKEETRGTDCVVRGKYGYVDPDGNKREFTYVSGNPCDPNAPSEEEQEKEAEDSGEENIPQNVGRPIRPLRPQARPQALPVPARPATSVFQNAYTSGATIQQDERDEQAYIQSQAPVRQRLPAPARPANVVRVTPRPVAPPTLPATTYRPQLSVSVTPRPNVVLQKQTTFQPSPNFVTTNFDEELKKFQLGAVATTPRGFGPAPTTPRPAGPSGQPLYSTELVFDPSSGQYNTVVYQQVPKSAAQPQYPQSSAPQFVTPTPPAQSQNLLQQQLFSQKNQALFQQSQDLYNQQRLQQQQPHRFQSGGLAPASTKPLVRTAPQKFEAPEPQRPLSLAPQPGRLSLPQYQTGEPLRPTTQYYFASPQQDVRGLPSGQIDAFLRNYNLSY